MDHRLIVIALGIVLGGTMGGYALGGYATGRQTETATTQESWWSGEAAAATSPAEPVLTGSAADGGPEHYVCHGCGPTLSQRKEQSYAADYASADAGYKVEPAPLPSYRPAAHEADAQFDLPDLDASHSPY